MNNNLGSLDGLTNFYGDNIETSAITTTTATITNATITGSLTVQGLTIGKGNAEVSTNSAFGVDCLKSKSSGASNTAIGYRCLAQDVSGNSNTGIGANALYACNGGVSNTSTGAISLFTNTSGKYNCGFGHSSLYKNTTGTYNTASGYQAGYNNSTGSYNGGSGYQTLYLNTTGTYNSAFGNLSGRSNVSGSNNSFLGYASDCSGGTAFNNSTAIGAFSKITASNQIKIGTSTETVYIDGSTVINGRFLSLVDSVNDISPSSRIFGWRHDDGTNTFDRVYMYPSIYSNDFNIVLNPAYVSNGLNTTNYGSGENIFTLDMSGNMGISGDVTTAGKMDISGALVVTGNITGNIGYMNRLRLVDLSSSSRLLSWSSYDGSAYSDRANIYASISSNDFNIDLQNAFCPNGFNIKNQGTLLLNVDMSGNSTFTGGIKTNRAPTVEQIGGLYTDAGSGAADITSSQSCGAWYYPPVGRFILYITLKFTMPGTNLTNFSVWVQYGVGNEIFRGSHGSTMNYTTGTVIYKNYSLPIDISSSSTYIYYMATFGGPTILSVLGVTGKLIRVC